MNPTRLILVIVAGLLLVAQGCATIGDRGQPLVPTQYQTRSGPYVVFTNYPLPTDEGVVKQLASLRAEVEETLGIHVDAGDHPIEVYILSDRKTFEHFLTFYYPELPQRRAFFIAQADRRVVYTFKGDRLEEDIRHEATHALLNLAIGEVPLWLDEGLAEYFEVTAPAGLNREHLARLPQDVHDGWAPDLERLESLKNVRQMTPRDYRESWAWVHFMLDPNSQSRSALLAYLGDLKKKTDGKPLSTRLSMPAKQAATSLTSHIDRIRKAEPAEVASSPPTVRLQDESIEIELITSNPKKRGFLTRLFGRFLP